MSAFTKKPINNPRRVNCSQYSSWQEKKTVRSNNGEYINDKTTRLPNIIANTKITFCLLDKSYASRLEYFLPVAMYNDKYTSIENSVSPK